MIKVILNSLKTNYNRLSNIALYGNLDPIEYYAIHDSKLIYIENAKVACSSVKRVLFDVNENIGMGVHELLREKADYSIKGKYEGYQLFTIVRNPYERLVSCYKDKVLGSASDSEKSIFSLMFYKMIFYIFSGKKYKGKDTTFEEFVYMVSKVPDFISDRHIRSQVCLLKGFSSTLSEIKLLKIENIDCDWEWIFLKTGKRLGVAMNKSGSDKACMDYYSDTRVKKMVELRYKNDFEVLGYNISI